jgi:hypothetical protein
MRSYISDTPIEEPQHRKPLISGVRYELAPLVHTVALGLHERRTGIICLGAQEAYCGNKRWEERHPEAAAALCALAQTHSQPDPTFRTTLDSHPPDRG